MKQLLNLILMAFCAAGAYFLTSILTDNLILLVLSTAGSILLFVVYNMLWIHEIDYVEQDLISNRLEEDRIPVIGGKKINWEEYRDIPSINRDTPIVFDRNKI